MDEPEDGMRIKKYIAPTMREALDRMRRELGEEATILSSRVIHAPNGDSATEVIAGIDPNDLQQHRQQQTQPPAEIRQAAGEVLPHLNGKQVTAWVPGQANAAPVASSSKPQSSVSSTQETLSTATSLLSLQHEMTEMRGMMQELLQSTRYKFSGTLPAAYRKAYQALRDAAFSEEQAMYYVGRLASQSLDWNETRLREELQALITRDISFAPALRKSQKCSVAFFAGATGAGKTTSLVKLAISYKLAFNADVLIISADTYKVGGMEQLQMYAMIANIPCRCVHSPAELQEVLVKESNRDFIFIDTVGRSHKDMAHLHDLQMYAQAAQADYTYVTLPATLSEHTFMAATEAYMDLNPTGLILTKSDECESAGAIIPALRKYPLPLVYIANGQRIPDDIEPANANSFMELLLPSLTPTPQSEENAVASQAQILELA